MSMRHGQDRPSARDHERGHGRWPAVVIAWLLVLAPLAWGIWTTLKKATILFR